MKILLADPSKENRERLKEIFLSLNADFGNELHVLKEVSDGPGAIAEITENDYDLLLCELRLGGLSGVHILQEIKKNIKRVRVILYGTLDDLENLSLGLNEGAVGYMLRPFRKADVERLLRKVEAYLVQRKKQEEQRIAGIVFREVVDPAVERERFIDWVISDGERQSPETKRWMEGWVPSYGIAVFELAGFKTGQDEEKLIKRIEHIVENRRTLFFITNKNQCVGLFSEISGRKEFIDICGRIRKDLVLYIANAPYVGIGEVFREPEGIASSKYGAESALAHGKRMKKEGLLPIWFVENRETPNVYWCKNTEEDLVSAALSGNKEACIGLVNEMGRYAKVGQIDVKRLPKIFLTMMLSLSQRGEEHGLSYEKVFTETFSAKKLSTFQSIEEYFEYLKNGILAVCEETLVQMELRRAGMAEALLRHITENTTRGVSVENLADKFDITEENVEWLCQDFFNQGAKDLIFDKKMETGKKLLLEREIDEDSIALMLGIEPRKFQEQFFKAFGLSTYELKQRGE